MSIVRARQAVASIDRALWTLALVGFISQVGIGVMLPLLPLYATGAALLAYRAPQAPRDVAAREPEQLEVRQAQNP